MTERLQKIISRAGVSSRREAESLIAAGRVTVNGEVVTELGVKVDPMNDKVAVDGKPLMAEEFVYIMLNKPKGVITSLRDPQGRRTVVDLLGDIPARVYPVGRLDYNTEGLLLLTNDGAMANALGHPRHKIPKTYIANIKGVVREEKLDLLRAGIRLSDGPTAPATLYLLGYDKDKNVTTVEITIREGRNRQVRRMFEAIGHPVRQLKRVKYAFLTLENLKRGQYRFLSPEEVDRLKRLTGV